MTPRFRRLNDPHGIYPTPRQIDPTKVWDVMSVSGRDACEERWHWICIRDLSDLASEGRDLIKAGLKWPGPRAARRRGPAPRQAKNESLS